VTKILLTGAARASCNYQTKLQYISNARSIADGFRFAGCEVDHRSVAPDEDLNDYDVAVVGIAPPLGLATDWLYPVLSLIDRAKWYGVKLVFFVDDWHFTNSKSQFGTINRYGAAQLVKPFFGRRKYYDWARVHVDELLETCRLLYETEWPVTLVPAFTWGNRGPLERYLPTERVEYVDLSAVAETYNQFAPEWPEKRRREWVLGVLQNEQPWVDKLDLSWPVGYYGSRAAKAEAGGLPESELMKLYEVSWGVLCPPHARVLGSGWWRYRITAARQAGAILFSDHKEIAGLGDAYQLDLHTLELLMPSQLHDVAMAQAEAYDDKRQSLDSLAEQLRRVIQDAVCW
jgi:hypothetical protein